MTILSTISRNDYTGNGATSIFSFTFKVNAKTDLSVIKQDTSGVRTTLVADTDFVASGIGLDAGGTITLNAGNLPSGYLLTIRRVPPLLQSTSIRNQSTFFPSIHEDEFDTLVMIDQSQQDQMNRSLKLPETEVPSDLLTTLPNVTDRASKFLAFDSSGNPIGSSGGISPAIPVSSFMQTVLAAVSAAAVKLLLSVLPDLFNTYRRPGLVWNSTTRVDLANNTGTLNQTSIIFHDGEVRSVTEDLTSTQIYRSFKTGQVAAWASGTIQGGLRSGVSLTSNTWYALYAVKCTKVGETGNFVLVGDTTLPVQSNFGTLNSNYGTSGWVYLGLVRYGDNSGATTSLLNFTQNGNLTRFLNTVVGNSQSRSGIRLATSASALSITYTYTSGTGTTDLPGNVKFAYYAGTCSSGVGPFLTDSASARRYLQTGAPFAGEILASAAEGAKLAFGTTTSGDIYLAGFVDSVLGGGANPQL